MTKLPISLIILAHQDQAILKQVVESTEWASDRIIYWTGADHVPSWIEKTGFTIVHTSINQSDFSAYRNEAAKHAKEEILFFVDSDEVVDAAAPTVLAALLDREDWQGAYIHRKDVFHGKELNWGEVRNVHILRIFRQGYFRYERPVHEKARVDGNVIHTQVVLKHYAHRDFSEFIGSVLKYIQLEVALRKKDRQHVSFLSLFAWPVGKFLYNYFLKLGLLDGWRGLIYAVTMSLHSFGLRATLYEEQ